MALSNAAKRSLKQELAPYLQYDPENAFTNIRTVRALALSADTALHVFNNYEVPSRAVSEYVLKLTAEVNEAMGWLATKITIDKDGCWTLPLKAEYDDKNRARYPTITSAKFGAKGELAHRFVLRRLYGAPLTRIDTWDHLCRKHSCCSILDGELVPHGSNTLRGSIARRSVKGELPLF